MNDGALPNEKLSKEYVELFKKLSKLENGWTKSERDMSVAADGSKHFQSAINDPGKYFELAYFLNMELQCTKGVVQFGPYTRGPSGFVHGGAIATVLDMVMAHSAMSLGIPTVTANLNVDYLRPIPLNATTLVEGRIDRIEGRKIFLSGEIKTADDSEVYSKGTSIFIKLNASL